MYAPVPEWSGQFTRIDDVTAFVMLAGEDERVPAPPSGWVLTNADSPVHLGSIDAEVYFLSPTPARLSLAA